jgi:hypothetical protein
MVQLPLQDAIILAALHLITIKGKITAEDATAISSNPGHKIDYYRGHLQEIMSAQSVAEHKATSGKPVEDLVVS